MAYSRISLNHIQQKTNLLTIAVIRKRRRWIANMAVACALYRVVSIFACCFYPFISLPLRDILNTILCHKYNPNHSNRVISSEWSQHLEMGTIVFLFVFCRHRHLGSVHGYAETRSRSNVWKEYTHNKRQKYGIELTFCWNCCVYALRMTLFGWFLWYSWPAMAY